MCQPKTLPEYIAYICRIQLTNELLILENRLKKIVIIMKNRVLLSILLCAFIHCPSRGFDFGYHISPSKLWTVSWDGFNGYTRESRELSYFIKIIDGRPFAFWYTQETKSGQTADVIMGRPYYYDASDYFQQSHDSAMPLHIPETVVNFGKEYKVKALSANVLLDYTDIDTIYVPSTLDYCCVGDLLFQQYPNRNQILRYSFRHWEVEESNPNYKSVEGALLSKDGKTLLSVPFRLEDYTIPSSVEVIEHCAFVLNESPGTIPEHVNTLCSTAYDYSTCEDLVIPPHVTLIKDCDEKWVNSDNPNWLRPLSSVTVMGNPEKGTEVRGYFGRSIPTFIYGEGVKTIVAPFDTCEIFIPSSLEQILNMNNFSQSHDVIFHLSDGNSRWHYVNNCLFNSNGDMFHGKRMSKDFLYVPDGVTCVLDYAIHASFDYGRDGKCYLVFPSSLTQMGYFELASAYNYHFYMYCPPPDMTEKFKDELDVSQGRQRIITLHVLPEYVDAYCGHEVWGQFPVEVQTQTVDELLTGLPSINRGSRTDHAGEWYTIDGKKLKGSPSQRGVYFQRSNKAAVKN